MHRTLLSAAPLRSAALYGLTLLALLLLPSCGCSSCDEGAAPSGPLLTQAPHFLLEDRNDSSVTYTQQVSPRAYLGGISAWYFGHAT